MGCVWVFALYILQICLQFTFFILQSGPTFHILHSAADFPRSTFDIRYCNLTNFRLLSVIIYFGARLWAKICRMSRVLWIVAWVCFVFLYFRTHTVCSPKPCGDKTVGYDMIASTITSKTHSSGDWKKNYGNKLSCKSGLRGVHSGWIQVIWSHPEQLWLTVNEDRTWVKRCTVSQTIDVPQMGCHHG